MVFRTIKKYTRCSIYQKIIERRLIRLIVSSNIALSLDDNQQFKMFVHVLNPQFRQVSRRRISKVLISQLYDKVKNKVREVFHLLVQLLTHGPTNE
jgi:hypothetical protein